MYKKLYNLSWNHLLKIRSHLGHKNDKLNVKLNSYIYGTRHNINIFDIEKIWKPFRYLFYSLVENIYKRNSFFLIGINDNLPMDALIKKFIKDFSNEKSNYYTFYMKGYITEKWVSGLFSNWKVTLEFIKYMKNSSKVNSKRYKKYLHYLKNVNEWKNNPTPDFLVVLNSSKDVIDESINLQIPILGLVDSDIDPNNFLYKFFGNNDSLKNIDFFFIFLKEAIKEGRLKEQQLFFYYLLIKLKKNINQKKIKTNG